MVIKYNRKTLPYRILLAIFLIVEMHYFSLFTLPKGLEFINYINNSDYLKKARKYGHFTGYRN